MAQAFSTTELENIIEADDLHIAPFRADAKTFGTPTWIWAVAVDGALYVRAYHGQASRWYKAAVLQKAGKIVASGRDWPVTFEAVDADDALESAIDAAYRHKYAQSPYLGDMVGERAQAATVRIRPRRESQTTPEK